MICLSCSTMNPDNAREMGWCNICSHECPYAKKILNLYVCEIAVGNNNVKHYVYAYNKASAENSIRMKYENQHRDSVSIITLEQVTPQESLIL